MKNSKKIKSWDKERHQDLVFEFVGRDIGPLTEEQIKLLEKLKKEKEKVEAEKS